MGSETGSEMGSEMSLYFGQMYWDILLLNSINFEKFLDTSIVFGEKVTRYFNTFIKITRYLNTFDQSKETSHYPSHYLSHYPSKYFFPKLLR